MNARLDTGLWKGAIAALFEKKRRMLERGITAARGRCPWCGGRGTLRLVLAGPRKHLHAACDACERGTME